MIRRFLNWLWDLIDISDNMHRNDRFITRQRNGMPSLWHAVSYWAISIALLAAVWYFDVQSTLVGLSSVTDVIIPTLPLQTARLTWWVICSFTILPTLLELFSGGMAKEEIKIVQVAVIGFTAFDAITDIPRAYQFVMGLWPQIQLLGWGIDYIVFWFFFIVILFFATIGLEVLLCVYGYAAVCFTWKIFNGDGAYRPHLPSRSMSSPHHVSSVVPEKDNVVIISEG